MKLNQTNQHKTKKLNKTIRNTVIKHAKLQQTKKNKHYKKHIWILIHQRRVAVIDIFIYRERVIHCITLYKLNKRLKAESRTAVLLV